MLEVRLTNFGLEDVLKDTKNDLESVVGNRVSKKDKDAAIHKAVGALDALWRVIHVVEIDEEKADED